MLPFGQHLNNTHYTENYMPAWGALIPADDLVVRRYVQVLPMHCYIDFYFRRFRSAIQFSQHFPYINPSRASPDLVMREGDHIILATGEHRWQTAVFLTTGIVSQCQLVEPGWTGSSNATQVRRIALCPFTIEYQHAIAFIGNALALGKDVDTFLGPLSDGNMVFGTRPKNNGGGLASMSPHSIYYYVWPDLSRSWAIYTITPR